MKNKWSFLIIMAMLNFALLSIPAVADPTPVWHNTLEDDSTSTVDGGAIVSGPSSYVSGAYGDAFAGNGSVYAVWDNTDVESIFGSWNDSNGSTVDLYFRGDHWDTHSGDSGLWSVVDRYDGSDGYYILSVRDGSLRFPYKDSYSGYSNAPQLTGVTLANNVTYRLTVRQLGSNFEVYLDGGAYSNSSPVYTDYTWSQTISFPQYNAGGTGGREMNVGNRSQWFGGILQSGEWVDEVRVYNGYYTPAEIGVPNEPPIDNDGDINDDSAVDFKDVKIMADNWLMSGRSAAEGNLDEVGLVDLYDYAILAEDWLNGAMISITSQPESIVIFEGQTATFTVQAQGSTPITYQWQKDSNDLSDGGDISGATTNQLQIANVETADEATYRCVLENYYSSDISNGATLTVTIGAPVGRQTLYEANTGRRYILYVPIGYDPQKSYPLIISSHGTSQNGDTEMDSTGPNSGYDRGTPTWPTLAEGNDVIVACPDMTGAYGESGCALPSAHLSQLATDDTAIINIISEIEGVYNINTNRIMLTGFSGGGNVVHYVGLRHPDVFSSICARHGNFHEDGTPSPLPSGATDMPVYIFTGTNDAVCGPDESITWYTAQGFSSLDTNDFDTYPSSEHTTDRHHALNWFLTGGVIGVSSSGHYVTYNGQTIMLVGDSGTQCAAQNSNLDHHEWIDDCYDRGIRAIHLWAFIAARQKQDLSVIEDRWGYLYPDITPWARNTSGSLALDQKYQWNLQAWDEGAVGDCNHYWPRMRDMASYAKSKNMVLGITIFTGWAKPGQEPWDYHPFNTNNGGHLTSAGDAVIIDTPGTEIWQQTWSGAWSNAKKTQWLWEQLCIKLINDLGSMGNVFFVFFDEHSYSDGNMEQHFADFFRNRGQIWMDQSSMRSTVDLVMSATFSGDDKNSNAVSGFNASPARPYFFLEGHPYMGDGVREAIWTFSTGGGNYFFHGDYDQETITTGIMGYDPYVPGGDKGMYKRDWVGHASRLFNEYVTDLDTLLPANALGSTGTYCLADNGREYVVYSKNGSPTTLTVDLSAASGETLYCRFYNPRTGVFNSTFQRTGGSSAESFTKPDSDDWVLHIDSSVSPLAPAIIEVSPDPDTDVPAGTEYIKQLELQRGSSPITWSVVQGPGGIEVDSNGLVNNWTPVGCDVNTLITIEIQAENVYGLDTETWQVEPKAYYLADYILDFNDLAVMANEWLLTDSNLATDLDCSGHIDFYDYAIFADEWDNEQASPDLVISNLSPGNYAVSYDDLAVGELMYVDRSYTYSTVPSAYQNKTYIKTGNDDKNSTDSGFMSFDVNRAVSVYVAHDDRITSRPTWLTADFTDTGDDLVSGSADHESLSLYKRDYNSAGTVTLGGNGGSGYTCSMYTVVVIEQ